LVRADNNLLVWSKPAGDVKIFTVPFYHKWFVAVDSDGNELFDPLELEEEWNFYMPPYNSDGEPLWDGYNSEEWPRFKFIGAEEYR
jgi:hypothetical protein